MLQLVFPLEACHLFNSVPRSSQVVLLLFLQDILNGVIIRVVQVESSVGVRCTMTPNRSFTSFVLFPSSFNHQDLSEPPQLTLSL
jgi:hypothetical protein